MAPPDKFQDPNVDMAKQVDLRAKDDGSLEGSDVPGLNAQTNDADGDGLDDNTGLPVDGQQPGADQAPLLTCPNCGFEAEATPPVSVNTDVPEGMPAEEPQLGEDPMNDAAAPEGAVEGDLCPACGKAPLEGADELAAMGETPPMADGEPDAESGEVGDKIEDDDQDPSPFEKDDSEDLEEDPEREDEPYPDDNDEDLDNNGEDDEDEGDPRKKRGFR